MTTTTALLPSRTFVEQLTLIKEQIQSLTAEQRVEIVNAWNYLAQKQGNFGQDVEIQEVMKVAEIGNNKPHPLVYDLILTLELENNQATANPDEVIECDLWVNHPEDSDPNYWTSNQMKVDNDLITNEIEKIKSLLIRKDQKKTLNELIEKMKMLSDEDRKYVLGRIN